MSNASVSISASMVDPLRGTPATTCTLSPGNTSDHWFRWNVLPLESALRTYLRAKFPGLTDLDDILQETYARVVSMNAVKPIREVRPYLFATARNTSFDHLKQFSARRHEVASEDVVLRIAEQGPDAAEQAAREQELGLLHEAIGQLPPRCREVFVLCKLQKRSHREIAENLRISEKTVETQITRAMLLCRNFLKAHGLPPS